MGVVWQVEATMAFSSEVALLQSTAQLVERICSKCSVLLQGNNTRQDKNTALCLSFFHQRSLIY